MMGRVLSVRIYVVLVATRGCMRERRGVGYEWGLYTP